MKFQIFIVFHKYIFDEAYKNIPDDNLYKYFTFIAVNKNIEKHYTQNKYKIINEYDLPIYDGCFQERGYNENSAIYHVYANNLHKDYEYIGFFQYDMRFNDNIVDFFQSNYTGIPSLFCTMLYNFEFCAIQSWNEPNTLNYIINDYEIFYNKKFTKNRGYPLFNSFIIPVQTYEKTMSWVAQLYSKLNTWWVENPCATHFGHIGGIYERIMGFALGEENLQIIHINVDHDHKYKQISY